MDTDVETAFVPDVMQVCLNGHVITDLLHQYPDRGLFHCDRCGAATLDHCLTCGSPIPGAIAVPGLPPAGSRPAPNYCAACGAAFPWTSRPRRLPSAALHELERRLRRFPAIVRELRWRQTDRPAYQVLDERDLEDLLRALLALDFEDVRLLSRTPTYCSGTRTDFLLVSERAIIVVKLAGQHGKPCPDLAAQLAEDAGHHRATQACGVLIALVYDPEGSLRDSPVLERAWSSRDNDFEVRCIIAS
jgi:REase_DpnII-MboI/Uncharacterized protein conserved in bacteria (DUF2321)